MVYIIFTSNVLTIWISNRKIYFLIWTWSQKLRTSVCQGALRKINLKHSLKTFVELGELNLLKHLKHRNQINEDWIVAWCFYISFICRGYIAPEMINCGEISFKSDIFSLGVIMKQIVTRCVSGADFIILFLNYLHYYWGGGNDRVHFRVLHG